MLLRSQYEQSILKKQAKRLKKVMHEKKEGKLKNGSGKKVTSRKQAIAIACQQQEKKKQKFQKIIRRKAFCQKIMLATRPYSSIMEDLIDRMAFFLLSF